MIDFFLAQCSKSLPISFTALCLISFYDYDLKRKRLKGRYQQFCEPSNQGARWPSGRVSDSGARGRGLDTYLSCVVSLSKDTFTPRKVDTA